MADIPMTIQQFIDLWLQHFASGVKKEQKIRYVHNQYIWHVFSYELIPPEDFLVGNEARKAFNKQVKTDCICCDMFNKSKVYANLPSDYNTAEKIDAEMTEFYVVAKDYSWTYIKTHENDFCGPYFLKKSKKYSYMNK